MASTMVADQNSSAGDDDGFHPIAVTQSNAIRLQDEERETLSQHLSALPAFFYLFSFAPPLPSPFSQPRAFFNHPGPLYVLGSLCAILGGFCGFPVFDLLYGKYWANRITGDASSAQIVHASDFAGLILFITAVCCLLFVWSFQILFAKASSQLAERMRRAYVGAVLAQDASFFDAHGAGEVATFAGKEMNAIRTAFGEKMGMSLMSISILTASLIIGFVVEARVTGFLFSIVPVVVALFALLTMASDALAGPALRFEGRASSFLEEVLSSMRIVQSFDMPSRLLSKYNNELLRNVERYARRKAVIRGFESGVVYFAVFITYSAAFWWIGRELVRGEILLGDGLTSFWNLLNSLFAFSTALPQFAFVIEATSTIKQLRKTIERDPQIDVRDHSGVRIPYEDVKPEFTLNSVTLAYPSRPSVASLKQLSLTLQAGKVTALVGPSGSGKSTITSLLLREYDPETANVLGAEEAEAKKEDEKMKQKKKEKKVKQETDTMERGEEKFEEEKPAAIVQGGGTVLYSGKDVRTLNVRWLRSQVAIVRQNPQIFTASVFENVAAGLSGTAWAYRPDVDDDDEQRMSIIREKVRLALEKAQALDFVERLPEGMDTLVSGGKTGILSGGQRQRLSLARVLVREPRVLVIDEGTSAIDTNTEEKIRLMLEREHAARGMTTVLIAHRLSTVEKADKIIVMRNGQAVDEGTHAELMEPKRDDQTYREMVMQQRAILQTTEERKAAEESFDELMSDQSTKVASSAGPQRLLSPVRPTLAGEQQRRRSRASEHGNWQVSGRTFSNTQQLEHTAEAPAATVELHKVETRKSSLFNKDDEDASPPNSRRLFRNIIKMLALVKFEFLGGVVGALIAGGLFPFLGWVTGKAVNALNAPTPEQITSGTHLWSLIFLCVAIAGLTLITLQSYLLESASERISRVLKSRSLEALMRQEIGFFDKAEASSGALAASASTYPASVTSATGLVLSQVLISLANVLGSVILAFVLNAKMSLVVLAPIVLLFFSGWLNIAMLERYESTLLEPAAQGASFIAENVDAIKEIRALGRERETLRVFEFQTRKTSSPGKQLKYLFLGAGGFAFSQAVVYGTGALVFWYGGNLLSRGEASITAIFAIFEAAIIGVFAAGRIFQFTGDFGRAISAFKAMCVWFERSPRIATLSSSLDGRDKASFSSDEDIVFRNVELRYPRRPTYPAIRNLNLRIRASQHQAFCGTSGSGKSTILQMVQRFYDPYRGTIHVGDVDIRKIDVSDLRDTMSYVSQDACLYEGTIKFNLLLGAQKGQQVSDAELEQICKDACILDFIQSLPDGMQTDIGAKGTQLSGGQRQRLCIARALVKRPRILLLDEATSALDAQAEVSVQKALDNASKGRTTLTVAHRLSTIRHADVIHVVEDGAIVESGHHDELIARRGRYLELVQAQL